RTYVTRRRRTHIDAAALLTLMILLLAVIPARLIVPGMTDLGRPGLLVGFLLFCWWMLAQFSSNLRMPGPQPIRWAVFVFVISVLISYAIGFLRGLTSMEASAADRAMLYYCVFIGVILTAADGVNNWTRLRRVLRALVAGAGIVAAIALVEDLAGIDLTKYINVPGLQA